jgi:ketosteroid isomerase-like protein
MRSLASMVAASLFGLASPALALSEADAQVVLIAWSEAYASRDHAAIASLYAPDARLRGMDLFTHLGPTAISEFFYWEAQKATAQSMSITGQSCQVFNDGNFKDDLTAVCAGTYELRQTLTSGETRLRPAQFSMALVPQQNLWVIYDHVTTWMPAVVAQCGTTISPEKLAVGSSQPTPNVAGLCGDVVKPSALLVAPVAASLVPAAR